MLDTFWRRYTSVHQNKIINLVTKPFSSSLYFHNMKIMLQSIVQEILIIFLKTAQIYAIMFGKLYSFSRKADFFLFLFLTKG